MLTGIKEAEYVGKTISKEGKTMPDKQIQGVMEFPKPTNYTQLQSYLGFINYFRDHVPNHSNVVAPSHRMIDHSATTPGYYALKKNSGKPDGLILFYLKL